MLGTQGQKTDAPLDQRARYFETGHAFEHLQERLLVDAAQRLGRRAAEQEAAGRMLEKVKAKFPYSKKKQ